MKFKIGEIAIVYCPGHKDHGTEVEIMTELRPPYFFNADGCMNSDYAYGVRWSGREYNGTTWAAEKYLRKKKPPQRECDQLVSWEDCEWKPERVNE